MFTFLIFLLGAVLWCAGVYNATFEEVTLADLFLVLVGGQLLKLWYAAIDSQDSERKYDQIKDKIKNVEDELRWWRRGR